MKLYALLDRFPWTRESLPRKLGVILFLATQFSLLIYVLVAWLMKNPIEPGWILVMASLNLGAWAAAYIAMRFLLAPIEATAGALRAHLERRPVTALPQHHSDVIGQLMRDASYLAKRVGDDTNFLQKSTESDPLTGLYSRRTGNRRLGEDVARAARQQMVFHFAFFALHGLKEPAAKLGNAPVDQLIAHAASLLQINTRKGDWIARWSDHLFAVGFCGNNQIHESLKRIHSILERSPIDVVPGLSLGMKVACGAVSFAPGMTPQTLYDHCVDALLKAQKSLDADDANLRVEIYTPAPQIPAPASIDTNTEFN
jgi:diguanylate cyclase (GGDEF)-like protein